MTDYFLRRVETKIVDEARGIYGLKALNATEFHARAAMAVERIGIKDIDPEVMDQINRAFDERSGEQMLRAFWSHFRYKLCASGSCLLVNPPEGLSISGVPASSLITVYTQLWLRGSYGLRINHFPTAIEMINVKSSHHGFFDEVVVFWTRGMDLPELNALTERVLPGSVLKLVVPNVKHRAWIATFNLDLPPNNAVDAVKTRYAVRLIETQDDGNVSATVLGIESK